MEDRVAFCLSAPYHQVVIPLAHSFTLTPTHTHSASPVGIVEMAFAAATAAAKAASHGGSSVNLASFLESHPVSASTSPLSPALVLYATVTGNAEGVAGQVVETWRNEFGDAAPIETMSMEQLMKQQPNISLLTQLRTLICVISTTGNGEEPDMARKFFRELRKASTGAGKGFMSNVPTAICGLGSSDYSQFCEGGVRLRRLLVGDEKKGAGAREFVPLGMVDEVHLEEHVEAWKKKLMDALKKRQTEEGKVSEGVEPAAAATAGATEPPADKHSVAATSADQTSASATSTSASSTASASTGPTSVAPSAVKEVTDQLSQMQVTSAPTPSSSAPPSLHTPSADTAATASTAIAPTTTPAPKPARAASKKNAIVWLPADTVAPTASAPSPDPSTLPSYYTRRWSALEDPLLLADRQCLGTEAEYPVFATLVGARFLTTPEAHKQGRMVVHMELEIPKGERGFTFKPGDSVGIYCANDTKMVERLLERLGASHRAHEQFSHNGDGDPKWSHLPSPCTVFDAFLYGLNITTSSAWKKSLIKSLAESCTDETEKVELFSLGNFGPKGEIVRQAKGTRGKYETDFMADPPTLLDLLNRFPSCQPNLDVLLLGLPPLLPRPYSFGNAQGCSTSGKSVSPAVMNVAWSRVTHTSPRYGEREGVCTKWMTELCQAAGFLNGTDAPKPHATHSSSPSLTGALRLTSGGLIQIPVFRKHSPFFALPEDMAQEHLTHSESQQILPQPSSQQHNGAQAKSNGTSNGTHAHDDSSIPSHSTNHSASADEARLLRPIIMVGPGTGVAPFRGFIQYRLRQRRAKECGRCAVGMWRGLECLDVDEKKEVSVDKQLQPPMTNDAPSLIAQPVAAQPAPVPKPSTVITPRISPASRSVPRGHYSHADDVVFHDAPLEDDDDDGRFGGAAATNGSTHTTHPPMGAMYLYFGCRGPHLDYLYGDDFASMVSSGILNEFHVAFSRMKREGNQPIDPDTPDSAKVYVQHRMQEHGAQIADLLLNQNAYLFVCGDGLRMASDVRTAISAILQKHGGLTLQQAEERIAHWRSRQGKEPTYIEDIWS